MDITGVLILTFCIVLYFFFAIYDSIIFIYIFSGCTNPCTFTLLDISISFIFPWRRSKIMIFCLKIFDDRRQSVVKRLKLNFWSWINFIWLNIYCTHLFLILFFINMFQSWINIFFAIWLNNWLHLINPFLI